MIEVYRPGNMEHWSDVMKTLILLLLIMQLTVSAESLALYGGGYSTHLIDSNPNISNESHDLIAVQYDTVITGRFNNSYGRESYFVAYEWNWRPFKEMPYVQTFTWAGLVNGYTSCSFDGGSGNSRLCAMAVAGARYTRWRIEPTAALIGEALTAIISVRF